MSTPAEDPTPCTSHTRPAHPTEGTRVFERDTLRMMEYDGRGNWRVVDDAGKRVEP